ncbi:MAG: hypothetical protein ACI39G_05115 [Pseudoramibacter sp.]
MLRSNRFNRWFNIILGLYFGVTLFLGTGWYAYSLSAPPASPSNFNAVLLFAVTIGAASALFWLFKRIDRNIERIAFDPVRAFVILDFFLLAVQLFIARNMAFTPRNDLAYVCHGAQNLVLRGPGYINSGLPKYHHHYFYTYPNNQMILVIIAGLYKIEYTLTGGFSNAAPTLFNVMNINLSIVFLFATAQKIYGDKRALWCVLKCLCFLPAFSYIPFFYTDTMAMPWLMAAVYFYISWRARCDREEAYGLNPSAFLYLSLTAGLLVIAYKIKGSAGLLLPVMLCDLVFHNTKLKNKIAYLLYGLYLMVFFVAVLKICNLCLMKGLQLREIDIKRYQFPMIHWIMMSASGSGGFHKGDFLYTLKHPGQAAKTNADWRRLYKKLASAPKFLRHMRGKVGRTWGDGTFMSAHYMPLLHHLRFKITANAFYFAMFFEMEWTFVKEKASAFRIQGHSNFFKLALWFLALFLLIWEAKSRYLVTFLPLWALI